jgi:hypothetical protein
MMHGRSEDEKVECTILDLNLVVASFLTYLMVVCAPYLSQWFHGHRTLLSLPSEWYVDIHIVGITPHLALLA